MNQGDDRWPCGAADSVAGDRSDAPPMPAACDDIENGAFAIGFWDQVIFALGFVPEMPLAQIWGLPGRTG